MKTILALFLLFAAGGSASINAQLPYEYASARDDTCTPPAKLLASRETNTGLLTKDGSFYYQDLCVTADGDPFIQEGIANIVLSKIINKTRIELLSFAGSVTVNNELMSNSSETKTFFNASGKLYVSDGTKEGTIELGDFGVYYCCLSYGYLYSAVDLLGISNDILYFNAATSYDDSGTPDEYQLWQTDGSPEGTRIVPNIVHRNIRFIGKKIGTNEDSIIYYADQSLWLSDKQREPELLYSFPENGYSSLTRTSSGIFFCAYDRQLWKIANDATVTALAGDCDYIVENLNASDPIAGFYYWSMDQGLRYSDGNTGSGKLVYRINSDEDLIIAGMCNIADKHYFATYDPILETQQKYDYRSKLIEISSENIITDITASLKFAPNQTFRQFICSNNGMVVSTWPEDTVFLDPSENSIHQIVNVTQNQSLEYKLVSNDIATKALNDKAVFITDKDFFFYLQPNYGFQVPVLGLLMQDENQVE